MRRLSGLDTAFLALDATSAVGHLVLLVVLDGDLGQDTLLARLADRATTHPALRRRLVTVPGGVGRPWWTETAPEVDRHVGVATLPDDWTLPDLAAAGLDLSRRPLPRDRPLWRVTLLRTPGGDRTVLGVAVHHAAADGLAIRDLVLGLTDGGEPPADRTEGGARRLLPDGVRRWTGVLDLPAAAAAAGLPAAQGAVALPGTLAAGLRDRATSARTTTSTAGSPLHGPVGPDRRLGLGDVPLDRVKALRASHDASVNDVVVAASAGALRRHLQQRGLPVDRPLVAAVPIARRTDEPDDGGNRLALARCPLPVHEASPAERLRQVRRDMRAAIARPFADDRTLSVLTRFAVPALASPAMRAVSRVSRGSRGLPVPLPVHLMVSNVPVPPGGHTLAGHSVLAMYPVPLVAAGLGLNVTVHGCDRTLHYGVTSAAAVVEDPGRLVTLVQEEHELLASLAE